MNRGEVDVFQGFPQSEIDFALRAIEYIDGFKDCGEWQAVEPDPVIGLGHGLRRENHFFSYYISLSPGTKRARLIFGYDPKEECGKSCCLDGRVKYSVTILSSGAVNRTPSVPLHDAPHLIKFLEKWYELEAKLCRT